MGPRQNPKAAAANERKQEVADGKKAVKQKVQDQKDDEDWGKGAKGKGAKEDKVAKAQEALDRKQALAKLLAAEEAPAPKFKAPAPKAAAKKAVVPVMKPIPSFEDGETVEYAASGIDNALEMLNLVGEKTDKASIGSKAAKIEQHPERRFKAAFEAYKEVQLPIIRKERPGMRLQQYHDALYKDFQKSPDNPFNQVNIAYDSTKEEKVAALQSVREATSNRLRAE